MLRSGRNRPHAADGRARARRLRRAVGLALLALLLHASGGDGFASERIATVAVFPVENLTGGGAPVDEARQVLIDRLRAGGIRVLGTDELDDFLTRHRVRYAAGIDTATAEALLKETGVGGVVFASIEMSNDVAPPKIALMARLVSTSGTPSVAWADSAGLAGDDAPGLFGVGLVNDYQTLFARALTRLGDSLLGYLTDGKAAAAPHAASKFRPKMFYRGLELEPGRTYSIAVVPFVNLSERRNAGEILAALFMRHLSGLPQFRVVDTGATRRQLLNARVIMDGGLSLSDADTVAALVEADFVLGGRVIVYQDYEGPSGTAKVEFSTVLIEKKSRRVVWSSDSYNAGTDGVRFFERGTSRTAHAMATQMVELTTGMIAGAER